MGSCRPGGVRGELKEYEAAATALRDAARGNSDGRAEGRSVLVLANARHFSGLFDQADQEARQVLRISEAVGDPLPCCWAANILGAFAFYQSRYEEAEEYLERAIRDFRACEDLSGTAAALCNLSRLHLATERADSAVELARQGTEMYEDLGHSLKVANGHYALGMALSKSGRPADAASRLREALQVFRASRQRLWEGMTLFRLAEVDLIAQRPAQAAANAEMAQSLLRGIGGEWRRGNVLTVLGKALNGIGQTGRAQVCWREALEIYEGLNSPEAAEVQALLAPAAAA